MIRYVILIIFMTVLSLKGGAQEPSRATSSGSKIVAVVQKMIAILDRVEAFECETEIQYYRNGEKYKRYRLSYGVEKKGTIRVKFSRPYPGAVVVYHSGDEELTIKPFTFLPMVQFRLSIYSALVKSPSGQRIDQCSIDYLTRFFYRNIELIRQR